MTEAMRVALICPSRPRPGGDEVSTESIRPRAAKRPMPVNTRTVAAVRPRTIAEDTIYELTSWSGVSRFPRRPSRRTAVRA